MTAVRTILRERALLDEPRTRARLFDAPAHPLARDVVRCLAARARPECGLPLRDLFEHVAASDASLEALFEVSADAIIDDDVHFVVKSFGSSRYRAKLLALSLHVRAIPGHKLNMDFWNGVLSPLPLKERDLSWSEHVRGHSEEHLRRLSAFRSTVRNWNESEKGPLGERARLFAVEAMWVLSSTVRRVRDEATCALYWYGRHEPRSLLTISEQALTTNDPYLAERAIAAMYGVVLARTNEKEFARNTLELIAQTIFRSLFAADARLRAPPSRARACGSSGSLHGSSDNSYAAAILTRRH